MLYFFHLKSIESVINLFFLTVEEGNSFQTNKFESPAPVAKY